MEEADVAAQLVPERATLERPCGRRLQGPPASVNQQRGCCTSLLYSNRTLATVGLRSPLCPVRALVAPFRGFTPHRTVSLVAWPAPRGGERAHGLSKPMGERDLR